MLDGDETLRSLLLQADQCGRLGSAMYAALFRELAGDYAAGGPTHALLSGRTATPVHDALPLRLAGAMHRVVLRGEDPRLARHYPTAGGNPGEGFPEDFISSMSRHGVEIESGLSSQVQTNEVGRSVVPLVLSHWLTTLDVTEYEHLEIGASAGLNLNFDRCLATAGALRMGDPDSGVRFDDGWFDGLPDIPERSARVTRRLGVDPFPIDVSDPEQELRLLSFVWPDQHDRMERLRSAISIARAHPPRVDTGSADEWLVDRLAQDRRTATVVFHSIVWQYLGSRAQKRMRGVLEDAGARATTAAPLVWARMEPAGPVADVQVTVWSGNEPVTHRIAEIGYHGRPMRWLAP